MTAAVAPGVSPTSLFFSGVALVVPVHFELELSTYLSIYLSIYIYI